MRGGKCSAYPNGKESGCYGTFSTSTLPTFSEIHNFKIHISGQLENVRQQVNAHEHTINHNQKDIELCFEHIEKIGHRVGFTIAKNINPFEFIAVDGKRRDDIRHIKNSLYELYKWILDNVQDNKERSKGIERLEEAAMWLNKSISRRIDNGKEGHD
jgi:hypothetical protein